MMYITIILALRKYRIMRPVVRQLGYLYGFDLPPEVRIGKNLRVGHRGMGTVIHSKTIIGDDVTIYHGVTIGRARLAGPVGRTIIGDNTTIGTGAVILTTDTDRVIGRHVIIGANSVVTNDVPDGETWIGIPARKVQSSNRAEGVHVPTD